MSTHMKLPSDWNKARPEEVGSFGPEYAKRLDDAFQIARKIVASLPPTFDPLQLLDDPPAGLASVERAITTSQNDRTRYCEKLDALRALSPEAGRLAAELDHIVGERMADLQDTLVIFLRAFCEV